MPVLMWRICCAAGLISCMLLFCAAAEEWFYTGELCETVEVSRVEDDQVDGLLHVASPDWHDQVIYFIVTDRFDDGNPANSDQGRGEYDPSRSSHYSGGDLQGILDRLGYIRQLGASAVWITPPVAAQWFNHSVNYGGYHGYWAEHFMKLDRHMGRLDDYRRLSAALHRNGMYLIQDIVLNHVGDFFHYDRVDTNDLTAGYYPCDHQSSVPIQRPSQFPFCFNDPSDPLSERNEIYHWTPCITDYGDERQRLTYQLSGLDDLNTGNAQVRDALRESYGFWLREAGVDALRLDTVIYVEHDFLHDFHWSDDSLRPGMMRLARQLGKTNFLSFGEAWIDGTPYSDAADIALSSYLGTPKKPEMNAVLNFSLHRDMRDVFFYGQGTDRLTARMASLYQHYPDPCMLPTFLDSHDTERVWQIGSKGQVQQAFLFLMTAPGIPVIYYGTEQEFSESRRAMFKEGYASEGSDHFDCSSGMFRYLQALIALRKSHEVFRRGRCIPLLDAEGPGIFAYKRVLDEEEAVVILNTAGHQVELSDWPVRGTRAEQYELVFYLKGNHADTKTQEGYHLLPAGSGVVYIRNIKEEREDS